jgi:hypothetical protein
MSDTKIDGGRLWLTTIDKRDIKSNGFIILNCKGCHVQYSKLFLCENDYDDSICPKCSNKEIKNN